MQCFVVSEAFTNASNIWNIYKATDICQNITNLRGSWSSGKRKWRLPPNSVIPLFFVFKKMYFKKCIFQKCISRSVFFNVVSSSVFGQEESGNELSIKLPDSIIPQVFRLQVFAIVTNSDMWKICRHLCLACHDFYSTKWRSFVKYQSTVNYWIWW